MTFYYNKINSSHRSKQEKNTPTLDGVMQSKTAFHFLVAFSHIHSKSKSKLSKLIKPPPNRYHIYRNVCEPKAVKFLFYLILLSLRKQNCTVTLL